MYLGQYKYNYFAVLMVGSQNGPTVWNGSTMPAGEAVAPACTLGHTAEKSGPSTSIIQRNFFIEKMIISSKYFVLPDSLNCPPPARKSNVEPWRNAPSRLDSFLLPTKPYGSLPALILWSD